MTGTAYDVTFLCVLLPLFFSSCFHDDLCDFVHSREVHLLQMLLQCQLQISNWQFLPSLFSLRTCQQKLKEWHGLVFEDKRFVSGAKHPFHVQWYKQQ